MDRLYKRSEQRKITYLDKTWDFIIDPENKGEAEKWFESFPKNTRKMLVPSCWNTEIDLFRYRGTAWYNTTFEVNSENVYINFDAVQNEADVYLDGVLLGRHYGGFLRFGFEVNALSIGEHTLTVRVNNDLNETDSIPGKLLDWYNYGGIARSVSVCEITDTFISDYKISYEFENGLSDVRLSVDATIKAYGEINERFEVYVNGEKKYSTPISLSGQTSVKAEFSLSDVLLWGIYKPNLYYVRIVFGNDDVIERIGFREIKT
jgi:beta-glucuronidase